MSTPSRGRGGGIARGTGTPTARGRGSGMRGRGRGRGGTSSTPSSSGNAPGLLQRLRTGSIQRSGEDGAATPSRGRGVTRRGRGTISQSFNTPAKQTASQSPFHASKTSSPAPTTSYRDFMAHMTEKFQALKPKRDLERKRAIQDGFLADPDKKTSLANAITPVGTCTEMCPEFERVERIVQNMVDKAEKTPNESLERDLPAEDRMIKRFRRSAAGYDEQLPSDIRTPETLKRTLDYLLDKVIGGKERLASIHKFVWDRTRGIRNDFSIQQVSKAQDVQIAVDCFERIARFHILSLHQLSNPGNLLEGENFDAHQEREQLNNTLLSLMYYYDDNRNLIPLPNEAEFRAYCILFELQALTPDLEERMQSWPLTLLQHPKVQTAFKVYAAAGNTVFDQGPLRPLVPFSIAQANSGRFWTLLSSDEVSYMMACVAEMNFAIIRFTALDALWRSGKSAPQGQQQRNQEWTLRELTDHLGFDDEEQTLEFVQEFGLAFGTSSTGEQYLNFTLTTATTLDRSSIPSQQIFSHEVVERKRWHRTLVAVINGISVATAIRQGLVVGQSMEEPDDQEDAMASKGESLFIPDQLSATHSFSTSFGSQLNAQAATFQPSTLSTSVTSGQAAQPSFTTKFGQTLASSTPQTGFGISPGIPAQISRTSQAPSNSGFASVSNTVGQSLGHDEGANSQNNPFQDFAKAQSEKTSAITATPSFTFGKPTTAFTSQTTDSEAPISTGMTGFASPTSGQLSRLQPTPISQNSTTATREAGTTSPLSTFFGEKLLKQQQSQATSAQAPDIQQKSLPSFTFAPSKPVPNPPAQEAPKSSFAFPPIAQQQASFSSVSAPSATVKDPATSKREATSSLSAAPSAAAPATQASASIFNFANPAGTSTTHLQTPEPEPVTKPVETGHSTTPLGSPTRPKLTDFKFPASSDSPSTQTSPHSSTPRSPANKILSTSSPKATEPVTLETPSLAPQPSSTVVSKDSLAQNVAQLALNQPQGLLEYFIGHHTSNLLRTIIKEYQKDLHDTIITYVKTKHLSRKYFALWKGVTRRKTLQKRGNQRRRLLAAALQAESDKRKRDEAELEAIIAATQETKRLQDEARQRHSEGARSKKDHTSNPSGFSAQATGTKRKEPSRASGHRLSSGSVNAIEKSHKRSRTFGSFSESSVSTRLSSPSHNRHATDAANGLTQSFFGRSNSQQAFRRSLSSHKVDSTRTDYFKLKAMGIDPETPLIPHTSQSLALRQQRQEEERQALVSRIRRKDRSVSRASTPSQLNNDMPPPPRPLPVSVQSSPLSPLSRSSAATNDADDEFLRSLRAAREAMSEDADWFKNATASLESEMHQQEALLQSQQSRSKISSRRSSLGGMAKANGYDYYAGETIPGVSLSRTERRIRSTGAHGLATKPIGSETGSLVSSSSRKPLHAVKPGASHQTIYRELRGSSRKRDRENADNVAGSSTKESTWGNQNNHATKRPRGDQADSSDLDELVFDDVTEPAPEELISAEDERWRCNGSAWDEDEDVEHARFLMGLDNDDSSRSDFSSDLSSDAHGPGEDEEEDLLEDDNEEEDEDHGEEDEADSAFASTSDLKYSTIPQESHSTGATSTFDQTGPGNSADDAVVLSD